MSGSHRKVRQLGMMAKAGEAGKAAGGSKGAEAGVCPTLPRAWPAYWSSTGVRHMGSGMQTLGSRTQNSILSALQRC